MSTIVVVTRAKEALPLIKWGIACALARQNNVVVIHPAGQGAKDASADDSSADGELPLIGEPPADPVDQAIIRATHEAIRDQLAPGGGDPDHPDAAVRAVLGCPIVTVLRKTGRSPAAAVLECVRQRAGVMLIAAQHEKGPPESAPFSLPHQLFRRSPCEVMVIRPGASAARTPKRVLVPTAGGPHASAALKLARDICDHSSFEVDALFVEPRVGVDAEAVGERILDRYVRRALGPGAERVGQRVILANDFRHGIMQAAERGYDLILAGASNQLALRKVLFSALPDSLVHQAAEESTSIAVMRRAIPVHTRVSDSARRFIERSVPQLDRDARLNLVERVQGNSRWNFDFISLLSLSTIIATLGLMASSAAVVIGAMLVAPLMTPLVGCGLALVQGNIVLIRTSIRAVVFGFLLAFGIALLLGAMIPGVEISTELLSRTQPNLLDLAVAFFSGLAAAYATARPNLSGALPGVAIAAALVPPIAASGVSLASGHPALAAGAGLLFATNIVAIVLGAAIVLFAVGVRAGHPHGKSKPWVRRGYVGLVVASALLAIPLSHLLHTSIAEIPNALLKEVAQRVDEEPGAAYVSYEQHLDARTPLVQVTITAPRVANRALANDLAAMFTRHLGKPTDVRVVTELVTRSAAVSTTAKDE